ncbi:MAG TPA: CsbD family protein [Polyangiaceae bacterium]|nr:CsbD family protein [Polyangiaceae bacterium]
MNRDHMEGAWETVKGKAKRIWAELTDDDFKKAEGSVDKLYGTIQKRFGDTKDEIKRKIDSYHM